MKRASVRAAAIVLGLAAAAGGVAIAAQDRYAVQVPNGLSFGEFRGYEDWPYVAVSQVKDGIKIIAANTTMIKAYRDGLPANGRTFPEGSKVVKIEWSMKQIDTPYFVMTPEKLMSVSFIEKDTKRFPNTHGWAFAQFLYDPASDSFKAGGTGTECGFACHTQVAGQDYIFTAYPKR